MVAAGGSRQRSAPGEPSRSDRHFSMQGREVFRHAVTHMTTSAKAALDAAGWKADDIDHLVPHQANARILRAVAAELGLPDERCVSNIESVGNTGAASIPLALAEAAHHRNIRTGGRVLLTAFGGGLTWGSCTLRWPTLAEIEDPHEAGGTQAP